MRRRADDVELLSDVVPPLPSSEISGGAFISSCNTAAAEIHRNTYLIPSLRGGKNQVQKAGLLFFSTEPHMQVSFMAIPY